MSEFHYLTMCTKEAMRLHTPVPFIQRQTTQNLDIDGKSVPVGTTITILIYNVHHNPFLWEDSMVSRTLHPNIRRRSDFMLKDTIETSVFNSIVIVGACKMKLALAYKQENTI